MTPRVLSSTTVNSLRLAFNRSTVDRSNDPWFSAEELGSKFYSYLPGQMLLNLPGSFLLGQRTATKLGVRNTAVQISDDLTLVRGRHQVTFGGNVAYWDTDQKALADAGGSWRFTGQFSGHALGDLLLGRVVLLEQNNYFGVSAEQFYYGSYVQDTWRATNRVTVNAGVRWEPFFGLGAKDGAIANFSRENFDQGVRSQVFTNAPAGLLYPGDEGYASGSDTSGFEKRWLNVSPRFGIAWDVTGNGRTAVRSSYGLVYDFPPAEYWFTLASGAPFGNQTRVQDPPGRMDDPYGHLGGTPHPFVMSSDAVFLPFAPMAAVDPDLNAPRIQQWNVTIEQQLGTDWGVSATYLGSYSENLWGQVPLNPALYFGLRSLHLEWRVLSSVQHDRQCEPTPRALFGQSA